MQVFYGRIYIFVIIRLPEIFDYLDGDKCIFEQAPLEKLAEEGQLMSYRHRGFWQCMDTMREKIQLKHLEPWQSSMEGLGQVRKI